MYTFTKLTLQAATAIASYDVIVTENHASENRQRFIIVRHTRLLNVYKFDVGVYKITR